jgi:hypothetical protein
MKNSFLNLFRMYSEMSINSTAFASQLIAMQSDVKKTIMFRFGNDSTILWSINDITDTIYGYHKENKKLLNECIEMVLNSEIELTIEK